MSYFFLSFFSFPRPLLHYLFAFTNQRENIEILPIDEHFLIIQQVKHFVIIILLPFSSIYSYLQTQHPGSIHSTQCIAHKM